MAIYTKTKGNGIIDTSYEGCVLKVYSKEVQFMSDEYRMQTYADVWDGFSGMIKTFPCDGGNVDLSAENFDKVFQFKFDRRYETFLNAVKKMVETPAVGKTVKIVKGRVEKNKVGKVFKVMQGSYQAGYKFETKPKLGIAFDEEMIDVIGNNGKTYRNYKNCGWVWAHNCVVQDPDPLNLQEIHDTVFISVVSEMQEILKNV